ncbi:class A beta-lactamase-related serine hydrolase [Nocardia panacis]|uniref:Class A beta-lactamase-related serine hydrolase n=1 Tax=Nocardia panacis TaxID=2340916 RepID=A0A3A4KJV4_9NOCA|nr:serine hydrolase domain-containing protein [Nocardia panacis]RJO75202.1 class A beta-lactamase-related serine hydrolase [Nocardia panacis]
MATLRKNRFRPILRRTAALAVVFGFVAACGTKPETPEPAAEKDRSALRAAMEAAVRGGMPGVQVVITEGGHDWTATGGAGDVGTGAPFPDDARVRIGSNTKTYVTSVLLQLVGEGKVELDAPVARYLPGVVEGNGNDGNRIMVRSLLGHTSGLADYLEFPEYDLDANALARRPQQAEEMVRRTMMTKPPHFAPNTGAEYSNTNFLLAGMVIERVTGDSVATEIDRRILAPLGLSATYFPLAGEIEIRGPHPRGYQTIDGKLVDVTDLDPSVGGAAGAMVASGADLNRFFTALLAGKVVAPAQLDEMRRDPRSLNKMSDITYGLGIGRFSFPCGKTAWGHGGGIPGFWTQSAITTDGRAVTVTFNKLEDSAEQAELGHKVFDAAMCS